VQYGGPSVRELEGALNRVMATAAVRGAPISAELIEAALRPFRRARPVVSVEAIQEVVSVRFGVSVGDLVSHCRVRQLALPRQIAMYLSRTVAEVPFLTIGEKFGGRDHSTIMYAVRTVETKRVADRDLDQIIAGIECQLRELPV